MLILNHRQFYVGENEREIRRAFELARLNRGENALTNRMKQTKWVLGILRLGVALGEVHSHPVVQSDSLNASGYA